MNRTRVAIVVELEDDTPMGYVKELTDVISMFRWVKNVRWVVSEDE